MDGIGQNRREVHDILSRFGWAHLRKLVPSDDFARAAQAGDCAPQRRCVLTPEVLVWLMFVVVAGTSSMSEGVRRAWGIVQSICQGLHGREGITEEAFCIARQRLTLRFWRALWRIIAENYDRLWRSQNLWKGKFRLLAVDGTEVDLPNTRELAAYFTRPRTQKGHSRNPQGRLVAVCSALTGFCYDFMFISRRFSEHAALRHLIRRLRRQDLLLLDRGFFSYYAIHYIPLQGAHFVMRLNARAARHARRVCSLGPNDALIEFVRSRRNRREQPDLPAVLTVRLIEYQQPGFRPTWLVTSLLDATAHPAQELVDLYHQRWRIETIYREWKHTLNIQNLRSHTAVGARKEMFSHLLFSNLVRWVMTEACQETNLLPVHLSFTRAITLITSVLRSMALRDPAGLRSAYAALLAEIRAARIPQRPNRSYPRHGDAIAKNKGHGRWTLSSRLRA